MTDRLRTWATRRWEASLWFRLAVCIAMMVIGAGLPYLVAVWGDGWPAGVVLVLLVMALAAGATWLISDETPQEKQRRRYPWR